jgi:hypothetical protein
MLDIFQSSKQRLCLTSSPAQQVRRSGLPFSLYRLSKNDTKPRVSAIELNLPEYKRWLTSPGQYTNQGSMYRRHQEIPKYVTKFQKECRLLAMKNCKTLCFTK